MRHILPAAVMMLMVSVGMSLSPRQLLENWRRLSPSLWLRLVLATFLIPPLLALGLGHLLALGTAATAGLFLVAIAPGAPLMTRGVAKKGFDMQIAASYQVWGALLTPIMVPLLLAGGGALYGRDIWVPPLTLLGVIAKQQFLPLVGGMLLVRVLPAFSGRIQRGLNLVGNALLTLALIGLLYKMGPALAKVSPLVALAAVALAAACLLSVRLLLGNDSSTVQTLSISNTNRHVGLALLLAGQQMRDPRPVPAIAAYAIAAAIVMLVYSKCVRRANASSVAA